MVCLCINAIKPCKGTLVQGAGCCGVHKCEDRSWFFVDAVVSGDLLRLRSNAVAVNLFIFCCDGAILLAKCVLGTSCCGCVRASENQY